MASNCFSGVQALRYRGASGSFSGVDSAFPR